ncbi:MAG TPA: NUDIX hydrolase [Nitrospiria bacterium]|nr:NUDIX hydrolase [Nitrospiria bacterium]
MGREIYRGRIVHLSTEEVRLPNGKALEMELVRHPGASAVVPLREDGRVVLIHQYRFATGGYLYEIPAGKLSPGEEPERCAERELEEEAGLRAARLTPLLTIFTSPGFCDERIHIFLGEGLSPCPQNLGEDEVLDVLEMPLEEAVGKIMDGTIQDAKSVAGLMAAYQYLQRRSGVRAVDI